MINPNKDYYITPVPFIISKNIIEYDIAKANANILLYKGMIDKKEYEYIISLNRMRRQIHLGLKQKDKKVSEALKEGFAEFREKFLVSNNLDESNVISIKKDAIFIIGNDVKYTKFDNIEFVKKNVYSSFFKINGLELYYLLDRVNDLEKLDVKGISDEKLLLHQGYMIDFLCTVFEMILSSSIEEVINVIIEFSKKYINMELPIGYYREFNSDSSYRLVLNGCNYIMQDLFNEQEKMLINTSTNYKFITELYKIATTIYYTYYK